ncbi:MAG TPA: hypothetical protein PLR86_08385 [Planctomycetota bacterium]|nr:hypothetical protein [Planctomycetota bacterium]
MTACIRPCTIIYIYYRCIIDAIVTAVFNVCIVTTLYMYSGEKSYSREEMLLWNVTLGE